MATSLDALEALLQFREGALLKRPSHEHSRSSRLSIPVPNPLDPTQPHVIEGDVPIPVANRSSFGSGEGSAFSPNPIKLPAASMVPDPLTAPVAKKSAVQTQLSTIAATKPCGHLSAPSQVVSHGFAMQPVAAPAPTNLPSQLDVSSEEVRSEKIRDALNSKPQRGKKRQNLNNLERQELTRTRNREHAKSTRMKKKARLQELMEVEQKYFVLKQKEELDLSRRQRLTDFVDSAGRTEHNISASRLTQLASKEIKKPEFSLAGSIALTSENSAMVRVSARGTDLESGEPKSLCGVILAEFTPRTADVCAVSLFWTSPTSASPSGSMFPPSVSLLSFE